MRKLLLTLALLLVLSSAFAGSNTAVLTCKSATGKTIFKVLLQDIYSGIVKGEFSIEGHKLNLAKADDRVILHAKEGVFTLYIYNIKTEGNHIDDLEFWAIPATFKIIRDKYHNLFYKFDAYIKGSDPRPGRETSPKIKLTCTLEYHI